MRKIFLAALLVIMMSASTALASGWEKIYTDDSDNKIYFDTDTVKVVSKFADDATFSAAFRMVYSDRGRAILIDWYRNNSIMPRGIENLSYDVATIQFKKEGERIFYYISDRKAYTATGASIVDMHYTSSVADWKEIPPSSVIEVEYYTAILIVQDKKFHPGE